MPRGVVPFWAGIALDTLDQRPAPMAAAIHGIFFGRIAPSSKRRRQIQAPALVVGHPRDPIHPAADAAMLADEMPNARFVAARSILEWRARPHRLDAEAVAFVSSAGPSARRAAPQLREPAVATRAGCRVPPVAGPGRRGTMGAWASTGTKRSCCAPRSWVRRTASSRCSPASPAGSARSPRAYDGPRSRFGSRLEPFTHVDLQLAEGRSLDVVTQAETLDPFASRMGSDYERYTAGTVMLETAERLVVEDKEPALQQFLLLVGALRAMCDTGRPPSARCSTRSCCGRWRSPATRRPSTAARGAASRARTGRSARRPAGCSARRAGCPGSMNPAPETVVLLGALLAGDWQLVEASEPRTRKEATGMVAAYLQWHLERGLKSLAHVPAERAQWLWACLVEQRGRARR